MFDILRRFFPNMRWMNTKCRVAGATHILHFRLQVYFGSGSFTVKKNLVDFPVFN